jgi:hypothetical protein
VEGRAAVGEEVAGREGYLLAKDVSCPAESVLADCKVTSNSVQPGWARGEREGYGEPRRN